MRSGTLNVPGIVGFAKALEIYEREGAEENARVLALRQRLHRRLGDARAGLAAGARWINDISALADPDMARVVAAAGAGIVLMHMRGEPATMQAEVQYEDVLEEVCAFLDDAAGRAQRAGIPRERIWLDPGIGFGKELEHNLILLQSLDRFGRLGYPVMVGSSRKSFITSQGRAADPAARSA